MDLHRKLELRMADFLGKEDAIIFNMGYATNSTSISALIGKVR
jgi:serine palmitoyltransferase